MSTPARDLSAKTAFGRTLQSAIADAAQQYRELANNLDRIANRVPQIGEQQGLSTDTATRLAGEALRAIHFANSQVSAARLLTVTVDYETNVPKADAGLLAASEEPKAAR